MERRVVQTQQTRLCVWSDEDGRKSPGSPCRRSALPLDLCVCGATAQQHQRSTHDPVWPLYTSIQSAAAPLVCQPGRPGPRWHWAELQPPTQTTAPITTATVTGCCRSPLQATGTTLLGMSMKTEQSSFRTMCNRARIIFRVRRQTIERVYLTQHFGSNLSAYDPNHTYEISTDLLRELRQLPRGHLEHYSTGTSSQTQISRTSHARNTFPAAAGQSQGPGSILDMVQWALVLIVAVTVFILIAVNVKSLP